ncbi:hypothetical protein AAVH_05981 [Aphelenchoides avenae]|nr:hypothetical protein AAVH_05981 [Aphelenchus avenae]
MKPCVLPPAQSPPGLRDNHRRRPQTESPYERHPTNASFRGHRNPVSKLPNHTCIFCGASHWSSECQKITKVSERIAFLEANGRCLRCLADKHETRHCKNKKPCCYCRQNDHNPAFCCTPFEEVSVLNDELPSQSPSGSWSPPHPSSWSMTANSAVVDTDARLARAAEKGFKKDHVSSAGAVTRPCVFCGDLHWSSQCREVTTFTERAAIVKKTRRCWFCLSDEHSSHRCRRPRKACYYCGKRSHHQAVCRKAFAENSAPHEDNRSPTPELQKASVSSYGPLQTFIVRSQARKSRASEIAERIQEAFGRSGTSRTIKDKTPKLPTTKHSRATKRTKPKRTLIQSSSSGGTAESTQGVDVNDLSLEDEWKGEEEASRTLECAACDEDEDSEADSALLWSEKLLGLDSDFGDEEGDAFAAERPGDSPQLNKQKEDHSKDVSEIPDAMPLLYSAETDEASAQEDIDKVADEARSDGDSSERESRIEDTASIDANTADSTNGNGCMDDAKSTATDIANVEEAMDATEEADNAEETEQEKADVSATRYAGRKSIENDPMEALLNSPDEAEGTQEASSPYTQEDARSETSDISGALAQSVEADVNEEAEQPLVDDAAVTQNNAADTVLNETSVNWAEEEEVAHEGSASYNADTAMHHNDSEHDDEQKVADQKETVSPKDADKGPAEEGNAGDGEDDLIDPSENERPAEHYAKTTDEEVDQDENDELDSLWSAISAAASVAEASRSGCQNEATTAVETGGNQPREHNTRGDTHANGSQKLDDANAANIREEHSPADACSSVQPGIPDERGSEPPENNEPIRLGSRSQAIKEEENRLDWPTGDEKPTGGSWLQQVESMITSQEEARIATTTDHTAATGRRINTADSCVQVGAEGYTGIEPSVPNQVKIAQDYAWRKLAEDLRQFRDSQNGFEAEKERVEEERRAFARERGTLNAMKAAVDADKTAVVIHEQSLLEHEQRLAKKEAKLREQNESLKIRTSEVTSAEHQLTVAREAFNVEQRRLQTEQYALQEEEARLSRWEQRLKDERKEISSNSKDFDSKQANWKRKKSDLAREKDELHEQKEAFEEEKRKWRHNAEKRKSRSPSHSSYRSHDSGSSERLSGGSRWLKTEADKEICRLKEELAATKQQLEGTSNQLQRANETLDTERSNRQLLEQQENDLRKQLADAMRAINEPDSKLDVKNTHVDAVPEDTQQGTSRELMQLREENEKLKTSNDLLRWSLDFRKQRSERVARQLQLMRTRDRTTIASALPQLSSGDSSKAAIESGPCTSGEALRNDNTKKRLGNTDDPPTATKRKRISWTESVVAELGSRINQSLQSLPGKLVPIKLAEKYVTFIVTNLNGPVQLKELTDFLGQADPDNIAIAEAISAVGEATLAGLRP